MGSKHSPTSSVTLPHRLRTAADQVVEVPIPRNVAERAALCLLDLLGVALS
jgi:hypothetical protein